MNKLSTFLWFNSKAEEAVNFYQSIFKELKILSKMSAGEGTQAIGVTFDLFGQHYTAFNGGKYYELTPAVSLFIQCDTQDEIDYYWEKLLADGGKTMACGWLTDKFGLSWQVIPRALGDFINHKDREKSKRAYDAMMQMIKMDIQKLQDAFDGK